MLSSRSIHSPRVLLLSELSEHISIDIVFRPIRTHQYGSIIRDGFCRWRESNLQPHDY